MKAAIVFIICVILLGCEKEKFLAGDKSFLFISEYYNYAWGFQHWGWVIDNKGKLRTFKLPEKWHDVDKDGYLTEAEMLENYAQTDLSSVTIDSKELNAKVLQLYMAAGGKLSDPKSEMFDAGIVTYSGFIYVSKIGKYKRILLKQTGDIYIENQSQPAKDLYNWMLNIRQTQINPYP